MEGRILFLLLLNFHKKSYNEIIMKRITRSLRERRLLISVWAALVGEITSNMRAVYVDWDEETTWLYFFFDGEFTEEEEEDVSCIETEVISQIPDRMYEYRCVRVDYPKPIVCPGRCVYKRKEPSSS
jgi:hypothetical protein